MLDLALYDRADPGRAVVYLHEPRVDHYAASGKRLAIETAEGLFVRAIPASPPQRSGHRGKAAPRPSARRRNTDRGPPDDEDPDPLWTTFAEMVADNHRASA